MQNLPRPVSKLIAVLSELPSIGPRQATRLAFYLISRGSSVIREFADNLDELTKIKICERCFFVHQNQGTLCGICSSPNRNQGIIMIVEKETDLISLENTGKFKGRYLIIGGISKTGILDDWQKLRLQALKKFIEKELKGSPSKLSGGESSEGKAEEIILGFNPTSVGDFNASLIIKELGPAAKKITRLGRGLPTGGEIEFADDETLGSALEGRG